MTRSTENTEHSVSGVDLRQLQVSQFQQVSFWAVLNGAILEPGFREQIFLDLF